MYIKPNEFEALLADRRSPSPAKPYGRLIVGAAILAVLTPVTLGWWALLIVGATLLAVARGLASVGRTIRQSAEYLGMLALG